MPGQSGIAKYRNIYHLLDRRSVQKLTPACRKNITQHVAQNANQVLCLQTSKYNCWSYNRRQCNLADPKQYL